MPRRRHRHAKCPQLGGESNGEGTPCKDALGAGIQARLDKVSEELPRLGGLHVAHVGSFSAE
ncbi:hypothetical protein [Streptomyces sp. NBC_00076]|uniref:hypothetical protein n=1 Tax=Streptomyces sp. NBC_00076 TaxID=2975642 RepID=UPI00324920BE